MRLPSTFTGIAPAVLLFACHHAAPTSPRAPDAIPVAPESPRGPLETLPAAPSSCEEIEAYIAAVEQRVPLLPVRRHVQGEDATSGFINELRGPGSVVLRIRSAWNGGCCNPAEITDWYLRDGDVVAVVESRADVLDGDAVLHGEEPKTRRVVERELFCGDHFDAEALANAREGVRELISDVEQPHD